MTLPDSRGGSNAEKCITVSLVSAAFCCATRRVRYTPKRGEPNGDAHVASDRVAPANGDASASNANRAGPRVDPQPVRQRLEYRVSSVVAGQHGGHPRGQSLHARPLQRPYL